MNQLLSKMRTEMEQNGTLPFARFMELALYSPGEGYYERPRDIGRSGDFFTSVSVGNLFGELLAFQFAEWRDKPGTRNPELGRENLQIIEAGAHDGKLGSDMLNWFKTHRPECFSKLEYCILEPSPQRRDWQRKTLAGFAEKISWFNGWSDFPRSALPDSNFRIVFSNELFDAMPVHRLGWDARQKRWFEWGVGWSGEGFVWQRIPEIHPTIPLPEVAPELLDVLPDGFTTEVCPAAAQWWADAAQNLGNGKLVAIDYGLLDEEFFVPERSCGTLRAFFRHHASSELLARPGEQDITAHVNFSALQSAGERCGLKSELFVSQTKFLTAIAEKSWDKPESFGVWNAIRRRQFQTLIHPENLGRAFRVLVQSR